MTIKEKIAYSSDVRRFTLFKEGLFYKCYNVDAMIFVQKVKEYKVSSKHVKATGSNVYSVGFPASEVGGQSQQQQWFAQQCRHERQLLEQYG